MLYGFVASSLIHLNKVIDKRVADKVGPDCIGGFDKIVVERDFLLNERAGIGKVFIVVDKL